jgi:hypothetical protein
MSKTIEPLNTMRTIKAQTTLPQQIALWKSRLGAWPGAEANLHVMCLYEDALTNKWAKEICERAETLAAPQALRSTWWKVGDLAHPGVLAGAVSKAMRSDVVLTALRATEGQPLPFYVWINSWWPHRQPGQGTLAALLGAPEKNNPASGRLRKYLRAVARQARMDYLLEERVIPSPKSKLLNLRPEWLTAISQQSVVVS